MNVHLSANYDFDEKTQTFFLLNCSLDWDDRRTLHKTDQALKRLSGVALRARMRKVGQYWDNHIREILRP